MHNWKLWLGIILLLVAILPTFGLSLGFIPVLSGTFLVVVAALGGYLLAMHRHR